MDVLPYDINPNSWLPFYLDFPLFWVLFSVPDTISVLSSWPYACQVQLSSSTFQPYSIDD
jgi:hypothetical protein